MSKNHFLAVALTMTLLPLAYMGVALYLIIGVDPLQVLHRETKDGVYHFKDFRYLNAGVIRRHIFEERDRKTVVLGSSLMRNTLIEDVEKYTGLPSPINLSIDALSQDEFLFLSSYLTENTDVENLIFSFDYLAYFVREDFTRPYFPYPLYTGDYRERVQAMFVFPVLKLSYDVLTQKVGLAPSDMFVPFLAEMCFQRRFSGFASTFDESVARHRARAETMTPPRMVDPAELPWLHLGLEGLLSIPERVRVHVLIPPWFIGAPEYHIPFDDYYTGVKTLLRTVAGRDNITVYAFDDVTRITNNQANYYDSTHYGVGVNRYFLRSIAAAKHVINENNAEAYLQRVWSNRKHGEVYYDPTHTASFEGPVDEEAFSSYPLPYGPEPLPLDSGQTDNPYASPEALGLRVDDEPENADNPQTASVMTDKHYE